MVALAAAGGPARIIIRRTTRVDLLRPSFGVETGERLGMQAKVVVCLYRGDAEIRGERRENQNGLGAFRGGRETLDFEGAEKTKG